MRRAPRSAELPATEEIVWHPEGAPEGPVTILVTNEDRRVRIFRAGVEIGRAPFVLDDPNRKITLHVLTMLEPAEDDPVSPVTGKRVPRWLLVSGEKESTISTEQLLGVIKIPPEFRRNAATVVGPGTTMVVDPAGLDARHHERSGDGPHRRDVRRAGAELAGAIPHDRCCAARHFPRMQSQEVGRLSRKLISVLAGTMLSLTALPAGRLRPPVIPLS